jgi:hypothetical protein
VEIITSFAVLVSTPHPYSFLSLLNPAGVKNGYDGLVFSIHGSKFKVGAR